MEYQSREFKGYQGRRAGWYLQRASRRYGLNKSNRIGLRDFPV